MDDAPDRWPPDRTAKVRVSTPLVGVEQRLQLGTRFSLQVSQQHIRSNETGSSGRFVEPSDELRVSLTLVQPVLRNFGFDVNRTSIRIAETNQEISESSLRDRVIRLEGEAGVAACEEGVIVAESAVRNVQDRHRDAVDIVPTEAPPFAIEAFDLEKALEAAFEDRPDYRQASLEIESRTLNERFTWNQLLPALDLEGCVGLNSLNDNFGNTLTNFVSGNWV